MPWRSRREARRLRLEGSDLRRHLRDRLLVPDDQRAVAEQLVLLGVQDDPLHALGELERRGGLLDREGGRVYGADDGDARFAGEGGLQDLRELRVAVGNVRSVYANNRQSPLP